MSKNRHGQNINSSSKINSRNDGGYGSLIRGVRVGGGGGIAAVGASTKGSTHLLDHGYGAAAPQPSSPMYGNRATTMNIGSNSKRCSMPAKYSTNDSQITSYYRVSVVVDLEL